MWSSLYLIYGLGIFLFGMNRIERSLEQAGQRHVRQWLSRYTQNPMSAVAAGVLITAMLQSSSLVTLLMMAFVSVSLVPLRNAIGVVIGANLGTTFTGWIVTTLGFKLPLAEAAVPLMGIGALVFLIFIHLEPYKAAGRFVIGLGCLLFGLNQMKSAVEFLPELIDFTILEGLPSIAFLLAGVVLTAIIQSSSATMMITLTLLNAGLIALPDAAAFIIGADLGTTSTSALGAITGGSTRKQLAMAHIVFNIAVDLFAFIALLPLLPVLTDAFSGLGPLYQLVFFHSVFNLIGLSLFIPFIGKFETFLSRFFVDDIEMVTRHLHLMPIEKRDLALEALENELDHLFDRSTAFLTAGVHLRSTQQDYDELKILEGEIVQYGAQLANERAFHLLSAARELILACRTQNSVKQDWAFLTVPTFSSNRDDWIRHVEQCISGIESVCDQTPNAQLITRATQKIQHEIDRFAEQQQHKIYALAKQPNSDENALSSLLNLNRELSSSLGHLLAAAVLIDGSQAA
jgi:phosphate:Na+ symporter